MASWKDSMNRLAQSAMTKSKEMAEITRLNVEISGLGQKQRELYTKLGEYLAQHEDLLPAEDQTVGECMESLGEIREKLERAHQQLLDVKKCSICPNCGAEVGLTSKFCDRCGTPIDRSALEGDQGAQKQLVCPSCGTALEPTALFCDNCGTKLETVPEQEKPADSKSPTEEA